MHATIVIAVIILGINRVKPSALLAKLFEAVPKITAITIVACMYALSLVMKSIPVGITYASFAGLCIVATSVVGVIKFQQIPNFYTLIGLILIISGVVLVNLLGNN